MYTFKVILYHNQDKSFSVIIRRDDGSEFCDKIFQPLYEGHKVYKDAYHYAYALSDFMVCDFTEIK